MEKEVPSKQMPTVKDRKTLRRPKGAAAGVTVKRYFTTPGVDPADELAWEHRTATITGEDGKPVFEQRDIEIPKSWSMLAINSVDDSMDSILTLAKTEGMLFKYGSGTGTNLSTVRSSRELLAGGGTASE